MECPLAILHPKNNKLNLVISFSYEMLSMRQPTNNRNAPFHTQRSHPAQSGVDL